MKIKYNIWAYFTCLIMLFLSMGYALLNDNLSVKATGIIGVPTGEKFSAVILSNEYPTINSGDGLYEYNSKYYFSGTDVNNYVYFNDEVWRVVSIEVDGSVKIVKDTVVSKEVIQKIEGDNLFAGFWYDNTDSTLRNNIKNEGKVVFDFKGRRPIDSNLENSYCFAKYNGCNAYYTGNFNSKESDGTYVSKVVDGVSLMKLYLEEEYFPNMTSSAISQVVNYTLNIGIVETNRKIDVVLSSEKANVVSSFIGLLNISDYVYATQNTTCRNGFDKEVCAESNWLMLEGYQYYLLNGKYTSTNAQVWTVSSAGKVTSQDASNRFYLRPVVVLNKNITVVGSGTKEDMYVLGKIVEDES